MCCREGKVLTRVAQRRAVDVLNDTLSMPERLACKVVGLARSSYLGTPVAQTRYDLDADLRAWPRCYATKHRATGPPVALGQCCTTTSAVR